MKTPLFLLSIFSFLHIMYSKTLIPHHPDLICNGDFEEYGVPVPVGQE